MQSKLKIAFVVGDFATGGGQIACFRIASAMAQFHDVFLVNARPDIASNFRKSDWPLLKVIDTEGVNNRQLPSFLAQRFQDLQIDLMHSHIWWADRLALQIKEKFDLPWVTTLHGCQEFLFTSPSSDPQFYRWARRFYQDVNGIAYLSEKNLVGLRHFGIAPFVPVRKIYNCTPSIEIRRTNKRDEAPTLKFILTSRAIADKGWDTAIEAIALVDRLRPGSAHLTLVGDGPNLENERNRAQSLNISHAVTFTGHIANPTTLMQDCHVGILPSRFTSESLPNSVVEYLQSGLAVIASPVGEIPRMVVEGPAPAGFITPPYTGSQSAHELAGLMLKYHEDRYILRIHSENALTRHRALFSDITTSKEYDILYSASIQSHYIRESEVDTFPRFTQDVSNIEQFKADLITFDIGDEHVNIAPVNRIIGEHVPGQDKYPLNEFVTFEKDAGAVKIRAHPLGSTVATLGPYTSSGSKGSICKVSLRLREAALLKNRTYSARARLKIVDARLVDHVTAASYQEIVLSDHTTHEIGFDVKHHSSWNIVCSFECDDPKLAPYVALLLTQVSVIAVPSPRGKK